MESTSTNSSLAHRTIVPQCCTILTIRLTRTIMQASRVPRDTNSREHTSRIGARFQADWEWASLGEPRALRIRVFLRIYASEEKTRSALRGKVIETR